MAWYDIPKESFKLIDLTYSPPIGIGSNDYDADMDLVASFVRAHLQPDNIVAHASVVNYYISRIYSYWLKVVDTNPNHGNYVTDFTNMVDEYQRTFTEAKRLDVYQTNRILYFLSYLLCNKEPEELKYDGVGYDWELYYPLPNYIGIYGLNTYLYAYFNSVILVGFPDRNAEYDTNKNACPARFVNHDYQHSYEIRHFIKYLDPLRDFYMFFITSTSYTILQKMCLI